MHTPDALAKHYIPYNAKVCFTFTPFHCVSFQTVKCRGGFCFSTMMVVFHHVRNDIKGKKTISLLLWFTASCWFISICQTEHSWQGVPWLILSDTVHQKKCVSTFFCYFFMEPKVRPFGQNYQVTTFNNQGACN